MNRPAYFVVNLIKHLNIYRPVIYICKFSVKLKVERTQFNEADIWGFRGKNILQICKKFRDHKNLSSLLRHPAGTIKNSY